MVLRPGIRSALFVCLLAAVSTAQPSRVVVRGSVPRQAQLGSDLGPAAADFRLGNITLVVRRSDTQQAAIERLLVEQQDPASSNYHRWLTPEAYAERFGAPRSDFDKLADWARSQGFTVQYQARGRDFLSFSGTAAQAHSAFGAEIHRYQSGAETHFANATDISLPAEIAPLVGGILGLHDFHPRAPVRQLRPNYTESDGSHSIVPDDFSAIYDLAPLYNFRYDGTGQTIAIVGQSDINPADIADFRQSFDLPPTQIQVMPSGAYPGFNLDEVEADLDLEWAGAAARNAQMIYVYSDDADYSAYFAIDNNLAPIVSESYGLCEYIVAVNRLGLYNYRVEAQKANSMGITWIASSGDSGAAGCDYQVPVATQGFGVSLPASVPEVTAVGGTEFNEGSAVDWSANNGLFLGSAMSYIPETSWNDTAAFGGLAASGGGLSLVYPKPSWQAGPGVPADGVRDLPDVALDASNMHDPYLVFSQGATLEVGGTSVAAPAFAGILAVLNQYLVANQLQSQAGVGNINPKLYAMASAGTAGVFHDITSGNNIVPCWANTPNCVHGQFGYQAGPGYDLVTGLGSVDAYNLILAWGGIPLAGTTMTLTANPSNVLPSGSAVLTATVKATSGTRTPTGVVTFTVGTNALGSAALSGAGNTATASITVYGVQLLAASNSVEAYYGGGPIFTPASASATLTVAPPATASSVNVSVNPNPVYQQAPDANGATFAFAVQLQETAGIATTITSFTLDGMGAGSIANLFGTTTLPANGALSAKLKVGSISAPANLPLVLTGRDATGAVWTREVIVHFLPASGQ